MIEKVCSAAENLATNLSMSRRGFIDRAGKAALGIAGLLGGLLLFPSICQAGGQLCCQYVDATGKPYSCCQGGGPKPACPTLAGLTFVGSGSGCKKCGPECGK
jgi:hypothetical protein